MIDHAELYRSVYGVAGTLEIHAAANERMIGLIAAAVRSGIASGDLVCARPDLVSRALFHGSFAGANDAVVGYVTIDTEELIATAWTAGALAQSNFGHMIRNTDGTPAARRSARRRTADRPR